MRVSKELVFEILKRIQRKSRRVTEITWGVEVEFFSSPLIIENMTVRYDLGYIDMDTDYYIDWPMSSGLIKFIHDVLKLHEDYRSVWEMSTTPMTFPMLTEIDVIELNLVELLANTLGHRASDGRCKSPIMGDRRSAGTHIHFRINSGSYELAAKMHNWMAVLQPLLCPLISLNRLVEYDCEHGDLYNSYTLNAYSCRFRDMASHYVIPPRLISTYILRYAEQEPGSWRGYEPVHDNAFFAVELNRYRKNTLTIEARLNEQHWMAGYILLDITYNLARRYKPPVVDLKKLYGRMLDSIARSVDERVTVEVLKTDSAGLFSRRRGIAFNELACKLLSMLERDLSEYTRRALDRVCSGTRMMYADYAVMSREIAEEVEAEEAVEMASMVEEYALSLKF